MTDDRFEQMRVATQAKIQQALLDLLGEQAYETITIKEIAERATVGTMTFYRHYADKDALLKVIENRVFAQLQTLLEPPESIEVIERVTRRLLLFVHDNSPTFRAVGQTPAMTSIIQRLTEQGLADLRSLYVGGSDELSEQVKLRQDLVASHFVFAQLNLIRWWSRHDTELSLDEMVGLISQLVVLPTMNLLSRPMPRDKP